MAHKVNWLKLPIHFDTNYLYNLILIPDLYTVCRKLNITRLNSGNSPCHRVHLNFLKGVRARRHALDQRAYLWLKPCICVIYYNYNFKRPVPS